MQGLPTPLPPNLQLFSLIDCKFVWSASPASHSLSLGTALLQLKSLEVCILPKPDEGQLTRDWHNVIAKLRGQGVNVDLFGSV